MSCTIEINGRIYCEPHSEVTVSASYYLRRYRIDDEGLKEVFRNVTDADVRRYRRKFGR